jgi:hypothetical protein
MQHLVRRLIEIGPIKEACEILERDDVRSLLFEFWMVQLKSHSGNDLHAVTGRIRQFSKLFAIFNVAQPHADRDAQQIVFGVHSLHARSPVTDETFVFPMDWSRDIIPVVEDKLVVVPQSPSEQFVSDRIFETLNIYHEVVVPRHLRKQCSSPALLWCDLAFVYFNSSMVPSFDHLCVPCHNDTSSSIAYPLLSQQLPPVPGDVGCIAFPVSRTDAPRDIAIVVWYKALLRQLGMNMSQPIDQHSSRAATLPLFLESLSIQWPCHKQLKLLVQDARYGNMSQQLKSQLLQHNSAARECSKYFCHGGFSQTFQPAILPKSNLDLALAEQLGIHVDPTKSGTWIAAIECLREQYPEPTEETVEDLGHLLNKLNLTSNTQSWTTKNVCVIVQASSPLSHGLEWTPVEEVVVVNDAVNEQWLSLATGLPLVSNETNSHCLVHTETMLRFNARHENPRDMFHALCAVTTSFCTGHMSRQQLQSGLEVIESAIDRVMLDDGFALTLSDVEFIVKSIPHTSWKDIVSRWKVPGIQA